MPRPLRTRAPYKFVAPFVWELAHADYMAGETAEVVAARYDIGKSNLQQTFNRRGWTRKALAEARARIRFDPAMPVRAPSPAPAPETAPETTPETAPETAPDETLFDTVLRRAREALTAGKGSEATALLKAVRDYVVVMDDVADAEEANSPVEHAIGEILPHDRVRWREAMALNRLRVFWSPLEPHQLDYREDARAVARTDREAREGMRAAAAQRARRRAKGSPLPVGEGLSARER